MRALNLVAILLLAGMLAGCQSLAKLLPGHVTTTTLTSLRIAAQPGANMNAATQLDVVFVYDQTALALLPATGPAWFNDKTALQAGLGQSVDIVPLQVPPAMLIGSVPLPKRAGKALAVYGFANYLAKDGQGRIDLTRYHRPVIWLAPTQITVTEP